MKVYEENNSVYIEGLHDFDLDHTFDNGQCFRWERKQDGSYVGVALGRILHIETKEDILVLYQMSLAEFEQKWRRYLDLDRDYGRLKKLLAKDDDVMAAAIAYGGGMRILKQDLWETIASFLISQNNNIPRIKKCIESICAAYGNVLGEYQGKTYHSFPTIEAMASLNEKEIDLCRLGYRGKYIIHTAKQLIKEPSYIETLMSAERLKAYEMLLALNGVGPKVANCIMLFGLGKYDSFPLDVWIKKVMHKWYHIEEGNLKEMSRFAAEHFGAYGGIAQQYLFYYIGNIEKRHIDEISKTSKFRTVIKGLKEEPSC